MTTSCVAAAKPNSTEPAAMIFRLLENAGFGLANAINKTAAIIKPCANNNHDRLLPKIRDNIGSCSESINGDHTNLNE